MAIWLKRYALAGLGGGWGPGWARTLVRLQAFPNGGGKAFDTTLLCEWLLDTIQRLPPNADHEPGRMVQLW